MLSQVKKQFQCCDPTQSLDACWWIHWLAKLTDLNKICTFCKWSIKINDKWQPQFFESLHIGTHCCASTTFNIWHCPMMHEAKHKTSVLCKLEDTRICSLSSVLSSFHVAEHAQTPSGSHRPVLSKSKMKTKSHHNKTNYKLMKKHTQCWIEGCKPCCIFERPQCVSTCLEHRNKMKNDAMCPMPTCW